MKDINNFITVVGNVGTDPVIRMHANNFKVTTFRLGTDNRRRNPATGEWETKSTNWYTIKIFNQLGINAHASIRKGQRVFVAGTAKIDQYTREDGSTGTGIDVEAQFVGHDLLFGTSEFSRRPQLVEAGTDTGPAESADAWADADDAGAHRDHGAETGGPLFPPRNVEPEGGNLGERGDDGETTGDYLAG